MSAKLAALTALALFLGIVAIFAFGQARRCPSGPMIWWLYLAERLVGGLLWRVRGTNRDGQPARCPYPQEGGALIVANHRSAADPIVLWHNHHLAGPRHQIRPISFLMAREFYDNRWLNWFYRAMRSIPVARDGRDMSAVRQAISQLRAGDLVGIFPEGGINLGPPGIKAANPGVAFLALSSDAPVIPVYIADAPIGSTLPRSLFQFARVRLIYGEPIDLSPFRGRRKSQELLAEATDVIMDSLAALGGVEYAGTATGDPNRDHETQPSAADDTRRSFPRLADEQDHDRQRAV